MTDAPKDFAEKVEAALASELRTAWDAQLATEAGRLVIWSILAKCHLFETTYTGNALSNFLEGERSIGLHILADHVMPQGARFFSDMMIENERRMQRLEDAVRLTKENADD